MATGWSDSGRWKPGAARTALLEDRGLITELEEREGPSARTGSRDRTYAPHTLREEVRRRSPTSASKAIRSRDIHRNRIHEPASEYWEAANHTPPGASMTETTRAAEPWDFAGWGESGKITDLGSGPTEVSRLDQAHKHTLGTWRATAICGNDITSSCSTSPRCARRRPARCAPDRAPGGRRRCSTCSADLRRGRQRAAAERRHLHRPAQHHRARSWRRGRRADPAVLRRHRGDQRQRGDALRPQPVARLDVIGATVGLLGFFALLNIVGHHRVGGRRARHLRRSTWSRSRCCAWSAASR